MSNKKDTRPIIVMIPQLRAFNQISVCDTNNKGAIKRNSKKSIRKPSEVSLRKFSVLGSDPLQANDIKKKCLILPYRLYASKRESINHRMYEEIKPEEKYKIINTDMRQRLFVENPPDEVHTVRDIDDGYFRYLNNHPPTPIVPLYKTLKFQYHEHLRTKQEIGYRRDCTFITEKTHKIILQEYVTSVQRCIEQEKLLQKYVSDDYNKSMECLNKSADLVAKVLKKQLELEHLANEQILIQSRLIGLNFMYFVQQKYGRFLYYVSPPSWRAQHRDFARSIEIRAKGFDLGTSSEEETFNVIFENMQNECFSGLTKPVLYFSRADTLISFFNGMEQQDLHQFSLAHLNDSHMKSLTETLLKLKSDVGNDSAFIAVIIDDIGEIINFLEEREKHLKARFFKILNGMFYDVVASTNVLKLQSHLEFCFEKIFEKSTMNLVSLARDLEKMYMEYTLKLEGFKTDNIKKAMKESIEIEKKQIKTAHEAARELRQFDRFERALLRTSENVNNGVALFKSVHRPSIRKVKRQIPEYVVRARKKRELTEAEFEYLSLFTDWTEKDNPTDYLHLT